MENQLTLRQEMDEINAALALNEHWPQPQAGKCAWCHKPTEDPQGYLCEHCQAENERLALMELRSGNA